MKTCSKCGEVKDDSFYGKVGCICLTCRNEAQRIKRASNNNYLTKKYEKTKKGFLVRLYRNMLSRISGVQKAKFHLYKGKELISRDTFYEWAFGSDMFHLLFKEWESSSYDRKLAPSVDRINPNIGYTVENMEWVTHSENSRRGSLSRHSKTRK